MPDPAPGAHTLRPTPLLLGGLLSLAACSSVADTAPPPAPTLEQLRSVAITGIVDDTVRLVNGRWEGPPVVPGSAVRDAVVLLETVAVGDLDGQPGEEAVAAVMHSGGGTGTFLHLVVFVTGRDGQPAQLGVGLVGDRIEVRGLTIEQGDIHLDVLEAGPADPMCCPTQLARKSFELRGGRVQLAASTVTGTLPGSTP